MTEWKLDKSNRPEDKEDELDLYFVSNAEHLNAYVDGPLVESLYYSATIVVFDEFLFLYCSCCKYYDEIDALILSSKK